jgi:predicted nucleic acid-binding protein
MIAAVFDCMVFLQAATSDRVNARYLVSRDKDLLDLMSDGAFVASFPRLQIVDPPTFLSAVRAMQGQ